MSDSTTTRKRSGNSGLLPPQRKRAMSATWVQGEDGRWRLVEQVHKPSHYTQGKIECIDSIRAQLTPEELRGYYRGCIHKYLWRYRHKNKIEDLMKAEVYLGWLMELERGAP